MLRVTVLIDTIVAPTTPPGRGGVGIVRISGPHVREIAQQILGTIPAPRYARVCTFYDTCGGAIDNGIALYFPAPHSFTGEDVLELQGHGGPVVMDRLVRRVIELGGRFARPGEFSERAFLNNKLDLAQAEAIADLIASGTEQAAKAALRSLQGEFSARIHALVERVIALRSYIEAAIDFPEEDEDFLGDTSVMACLDELRGEIAIVLNGARQGNLLTEGMSVVVAGKPNAGKSSLLNRLAGHEAAIVTEIPGTTRDVLREYIHIDGLPLHIIDTAGLREGGDLVEQEGMRRAWKEIACADAVLLVTENQEALDEDERAIVKQLPPGVPLTIVHNKIDLAEREPALVASGVLPPATLAHPCASETWLSAKTGVGLDLLRVHLKRCAGYQDTTEGIFSARRRHLDALHRAEDAILNGQRQLKESRAGELLAEELRQAQGALSEITGEFSSEDLLGRIFSGFCIGK
jgi:tRNA modification GTPase